MIRIPSPAPLPPCGSCGSDNSPGFEPELWFETRPWEGRVVASEGGPARVSLVGTSEYHPFARSTPYSQGVGNMIEVNHAMSGIVLPKSRP